MKKKFREMHEQMQQEDPHEQNFRQNPSDHNAQGQPDKNDYIDFEEVK